MHDPEPAPVWALLLAQEPEQEPEGPANTEQEQPQQTTPPRRPAPLDHLAQVPPSPTDAAAPTPERSPL